ncbi:hypothetical protein [Sulfuriflexus mobilis]|uniref:hypothetical protein n=1 Tax=Sulfuriflexus mobilis TaxID=1811807 RepID=UPI000F8325AC|nr:hypothetical protein [Sulfuriflexus mobilis]
MPQTDHSYSESVTKGLYLIHDSAWAIREDDDANSLVDLTDAITERLAKAEAISRLLIGSQDYPNDATIADAAWAITDLIHETRELYARQWQRVRHYEQGDK